MAWVWLQHAWLVYSVARQAVDAVKWLRRERD
jgi:hypothetical protein